MGIGKSINGGFGLVLDGTRKKMGSFDPHDVGRHERRGTASLEPLPQLHFHRHEHNKKYSNHITLPFLPEESLVKRAVAEGLAKKNRG